MSKEDVINYVMTTPGNPNKAVLSGMLDSVADAGGGSTMIVNVDVTDPQNPTIDRAFQEIKDAYNNGIEVIAKYPYTGGPGGTTYANARISAIDVTNGEIMAFRFQTVDSTGSGTIVASVFIADGSASYSNRNL